MSAVTTILRLISLTLPGLEPERLRGKMGLDDEALLPYAGLISQKPHSTNALQNILSDYFGVPAKIEQFTGQWLPLSPSDYTKLGIANGKLGENSIAGTRIWDQQSKFRVRLGPLNLKQFQGFLPSGFGKPGDALDREIHRRTRI